jgi:uncharacterized membrane-anchored protein
MITQKLSEISRPRFNTLLNTALALFLFCVTPLAKAQGTAEPAIEPPPTAAPGTPAAPDNSGPPEIEGVTWLVGPAEAKMGNLAKIRVPEGYVFADGDSTRRIMELMQNFPSPQMQGMIATPNLNWFVVFEFNPIGYVKDDEKDKLDADKMLADLKANDEAANEERRKRGWSEMFTTGWVKPPFYNEATKRIEWGLRVEGEQGASVNYLAKLLGRSGVMEATLVTDPEILEPTLPNFTNLLTGYDFQAGESYAEYKQGDKLAAIGLTALVTGGGLAVAAKMGLLERFWKFIVGGIIAIAYFFRKLFAGLFGRRDAA